MSSGCGEFAFVGDGLKVKGSSLLGEVGLWARRRNQCDFGALFVDRKISRRLENQLLDWFEPDQVFDPFIDLNEIWRNFDLGCSLGRFFAPAARAICHENRVWRQTAKMKL